MTLIIFWSTDHFDFNNGNVNLDLKKTQQEL